VHNIIPYLILGFAAGVVSGMTGIGGGVIILPALVFLFGFSQHQAQGTTLALLVPPIDLLAAWIYYKQEYVDLTVAALVCLGFFFGGFLGAKVGTMLPNAVLSKTFAVILLLSAMKVFLTNSSDIAP
jgi:uncharacterized membrane protein YfcA